MAAGDVKPKPAFGFLTVLEYPQHGLFGGYLVLNTAGRPLEFHCTAPIKPNRAQQILYGPTLESFLYGEQIGQTLLAEADAEPLLVCTDRPPALAVRQHVSLPVALVLPAEGPSSVPSDDPHPLDEVACDGHRLVPFELGRNRLAVLEPFDDDRRLITQRIGDLAESFDLAEPFIRIREAIEEAQQAVRSSSCPAA